MKTAIRAMTLALVISQPAISEAQESFSAGIAYATDYITTGISNSNGKPYIVSYLRVDNTLGFYAGVYLSTIEYEGATDRIETSYFGGYQTEFGKYALNLVLYHSYLDDYGASGDEVWVEIDRKMTSSLTLGAVYKDDFSGLWSGGPTFSYDFGSGIVASGIYEIDNQPVGEDSAVIGVNKYFENGLSLGLAHNKRKFVSDKLVAIVGYDIAF